MGRGLDQDRREHVQEQQSRAHDDYQRRDRRRQQRTAMVFACVAIVIAAIVVVATVLTGGALVAPCIGLASAIASALLQCAAMRLEADASLKDETKRKLQRLISIVQNVVMIGSMLFSFFAPGASVAAEAAAAAATAAHVVGHYLTRISACLRKIVAFLRTHQQAKGILQQFDKLLRMIGIGGASVVLLNIGKGLLGMLDTVLDGASGILSIYRELRSLNQSPKQKQSKQQQQQQQQQQQEEEDEEEEEEEDDEGSKDNLTKIAHKTTESTLVRSDGWKLQQCSVLLSACCNDQGIQGNPLTYTLSKPGVEDINVKFCDNKETGKSEPVFSRELSQEEQGVFGFSDVPEENTETLAALFQHDTYSSGAVRILSETKVVRKRTTYFDEHGVAVKERHLVATDDGNVELVKYLKSGREVLKIHPKGEPKVKPLYLDLSKGSDMAARIRGELTDRHVQLLGEHYGKDATALSEEVAPLLVELAALAEKNQHVVRKQREQAKQQRRDSVPSDERSQAPTSAQRRVAGAVRSFLVQLVTWVPGGSLLLEMWPWVADTAPGKWISGKLADVWTSACELATKGWDWVAGTIVGKALTKAATAAASCWAAVKSGPREAWNWAFGSRSTAESREKATPENSDEQRQAKKNAALVERFLHALLPKEAQANQDAADNGSDARIQPPEPQQQGRQQQQEGRQEGQQQEQQGRQQQEGQPEGQQGRQQQDEGQQEGQQDGRQQQDEGQRQGQQKRPQRSLEERLSDAAFVVFDILRTQPGDAFHQAVEVLVRKFKGRDMSAEEKEKLHKKIKEDGAAKPLFDFMYVTAKDQQTASNQPPGHPDGNSARASTASQGAVLRQHMRKVNGIYTRQHMTFLAAPSFKQDEVGGVARQLSDHFGLDNGEGIKQHVSAIEIQAELEKFIREGDRQGLIEYTRRLLARPMPEEFNSVPGMAAKWEKLKAQEGQIIGAQLVLLAEHGWSQMTDATVAKTTHDLAKLLSESVSNLWVEDKAEALIDKAVAEDEAVHFEWDKRASAYRMVEKNGKLRLATNKGAMGEIHEAHVRKILQQRGFEVIDAKLPGNTGMDILAVKRDASGQVVRVWVVECKATGQDRVNSPHFSNTKKGKQLTSTWVAEKIEKMYRQGGHLRASAIMLRKNLAQVRTVVAFQKQGINSWAHQNRVPEFKPQQVEDILQENVPEWVLAADDE